MATKKDELDDFMEDAKGGPLSPLAAALVATRNGVGSCGKFTMPEGSRLAGVEIGVRWIPVDVRLRANATAPKVCVQKLGMTQDDLYTELGDKTVEAEIMVQILAEALVFPDSPKKTFAKDSDELRASLDEDELAICFREWQAWQRKRSPLARANTPEEVEAIVDALGKGYVKAGFLKSCEFSSLLTISLSLVDRLAKLQKAISLQYGRQSEPSPESTPETETTSEK